MIDRVLALAQRYKAMGYYTSVAEYPEPAINLADNDDLFYYYLCDTSTGMFVRFRYENDELIAHVNTIVVARKARRQGLGRELIAVLVDEIEPDVIEIDDQSDGFWKGIEPLFPAIRFEYES